MTKKQTRTELFKDIDGTLEVEFWTDALGQRVALLTIYDSYEDDLELGSFLLIEKDLRQFINLFKEEVDSDGEKSEYRKG